MKVHLKGITLSYSRVWERLMFNLACNMMRSKLQCLFGEPDFPKWGLKGSLLVNVQRHHQPGHLSPSSSFQNTYKCPSFPLPQSGSSSWCDWSRGLQVNKKDFAVHGAVVSHCCGVPLCPHPMFATTLWPSTAPHWVKWIPCLYLMEANRHVQEVIYPCSDSMV